MDAAARMTDDPTTPVAEPAASAEHEIAADLVRHTAMLTPVAMIVGGLLAGWPGVAGGLLGMIVVAANFLMLARLMSGAGRLGAMGAAAGAMIGYLSLIIFVTILGVIVREIDAIDLRAFVLTVAIAHIVVLAWAVPRVGLTLGAPGLKPRPLSRQK